MEDEKLQNERVLQQCRVENIDLQAALNDSKGRNQDLLRKIEEGMHLWATEKSNLECTVAGLYLYLKLILYIPMSTYWT